MEETGLSMTDLRNRNINAAIVAAEAAKKAMEETATAAKSTAAATAEATKNALQVVSSAAESSATKVKEAFDKSLNSVKDIAISTGAQVKEAFAVDLTEPIDRFGDRLARMATGGAGDALATAAAGGGGGGGVGFEDQNSLRLAALMEALPTIMERAVKHGLQTTGRKVRN